MPIGIGKKIPFELPKDIMQSIHNVFISHFRNTLDTPYWGLTQVSAFTTKSCYHSLLEKSTNSPTQLINFKWIWKLPILSKIKIFIWLLCHDRLPTKVYLNRIGLIQSNTCAYCQDTEENIRHVFLECKNVTVFWEELGLANLIRHIHTIQGTTNWLYALINSNNYNLPHKLARTVSSMYAYGIFG